MVERIEASGRTCRSGGLKFDSPDLLSRTQRDVLSLFLELQDNGESVDVS